MTEILMIQRSPYRWDLVTDKGHVMVDGMYHANAVKAEEWVKSYISTWSTWKYRMVPK